MSINKLMENDIEKAFYHSKIAYSTSGMLYFLIFIKTKFTKTKRFNYYQLFRKSIL